MLSFLYPAFLLGAAAVAIPLLLHLLRNQEAPELRFGAARLLRGVKVEHAQRRRIRDWLLLALRAAALLLLAFAFARPYLPGRQTASGRTAVIMLDRSGSMAPAVVWNRARAAALAAIDRAARGEALALVAFDDRADLLVGPTFDRGSLKAAIDRLKPGLGGTRYQAAMSRAVSVLDEADDLTGRMVLISDLQGAPADARAIIPESITLEVSGVAAPVENVAILGARRTAEGVAVTLRNDGASARRVRLRVEADGRLLSEQTLDLAASQAFEAVIRTSAAAGPLRVALADPDASGLTADDVRYVDRAGTERLRVLVVSGSDENFYVDAALRAADDTPEFDVTDVRAQGTAAVLAADPPPQVVFLVDLRGLDRGGREALVRFVQNGGGAFVAASDRLNEPAFAPLVEGMEISAPRGDDAVLTLASVDARHPLFKELGLASEALSGARFTRAWRLRATGWQMLARFDDGAGALFERAIGRGRVVLFASDVNRGWNDLPLQSSFVPFVQQIARYLAPGRDPREYTPGTLPAGAPAEPGVVQLASGRRVLVNVDPRESDPARMTTAQFAGAVKHRGVRRADREGARRRAQAAEQGQGFWRYGLLLMFGTLVAEGLVGSRRRA